MVILMTSLSSSKTEFSCIFYDVFGVGSFTGLIRGRVLTILLWSFSHLLIIDISLKIVLALVQQTRFRQIRSSYAKVVAVLILPVLHREVVPPRREVVPVDRYDRCLERLYRSRIGPEVVPVM